jgi:adenine phosphoribosyltransferase
VHPGPKAVQVSAPDWRGRTLAYEVQREAVDNGDLVLLVDDWAETGSQALAARALVVECGGSWAGASLLVDQLEPEVRGLLAPVRSVVLSQQLPPNPGWASRRT